jgi:hypothetical protein
MTNYEKNFLVILIPVLFIYSINEIKRGYGIIKHGRYIPSFAEKLRNKIPGLDTNNQKEADYVKKMELTNGQMRSGYYSLIGGILTLIIIVWWIIKAIVP